jgi:hypothetical protein
MYAILHILTTSGYTDLQSLRYFKFINGAYIENGDNLQATCSKF